MNLSDESKAAILASLLGVKIGNTEGQVLDERGEWKIVVLQRGWVAVGKYYNNNSECRLEEASIIRQWGTKKGLGELALNGPQSDTRLDKSGVIRFNLGAEVCRMDCQTSNWN